MSLLPKIIQTHGPVRHLRLCSGRDVFLSIEPDAYRMRLTDSSNHSLAQMCCRFETDTSCHVLCSFCVYRDCPKLQRPGIARAAIVFYKEYYRCTLYYRPEAIQQATPQLHAFLRKMVEKGVLNEE